MNKTYTIEPKPVKMSKTGQAQRPFCLDGKEIYLLNMNAMLSEGEQSQKEMEAFCQAVSEHIGVSISKEKLTEAIQKRQIIIGD